jgi:hypothetical protein
MHARWTIAGSLAVTLVAGALVAPQAGAAELPGNRGLGGYQVTNPSPEYMSVQAQITVPTVTCTAADSVVDATARVVTTTVDVSASIVASCTGGVPSYQAEAFGEALDMSVSAGDKVILRAWSTSGFAKQIDYAANVYDRTTGVTKGNHSPKYSTITPVNASLGIVPSISGDPIADFGKIQWVNAYYDTDGSRHPPFGSASPVGYALIKNPNHPKYLVSTSPLSASGESFTNTWVAGS